MNTQNKTEKPSATPEKIAPRYDTEQNVRTFRHRQYDDDSRFDADGYQVEGYLGIAWTILGWELESDEDTEWTGIYSPTGKVLAIMKGDDRVFSFDLEDFTPLDSEDYCPGCGQIGCRAYH